MYTKATLDVELFLLTNEGHTIYVKLFLVILSVIGKGHLIPFGCMKTYNKEIRKSITGLWEVWSFLESKVRQLPNNDSMAAT